MKKTLIIALIMSMAAVANAATVNVVGDITTSTTWTADNEYQLNGEIFVKGGATLTIQAGTVINSIPAQQGALIITRSGKIMALGTEDNPIIFTATTDNRTGWQELLNQWGNVTICGEGLIAASHDDGNPVSYLLADGTTVVTNTKTPSATNKTQMEGLKAAFEGDQDVLYGGGNDNDDSGEFMYVSIRYGGKNTSLPNKELNGLSLGAIGRETDIHHVEIMNNVDDGIEVWGGCVNLKYCSIWNIGDDSFDFDQGWRGQAQFFCIVQGYSADAPQGSGVGDNCIEHDGAEDSDAQPMTTTTLYNFTVIGQPGGDGAMAWRDNARIQHRAHIFMDIGERVCRIDNVDGDGAQGYGYNGTHTINQTFATSYTSPDTGSNAGTGVYAPSVIYKAQSAGNATYGQGNLSEVTDCLFYNCDFAGEGKNGMAILFTNPGGTTSATAEVTDTNLILNVDGGAAELTFALTGQTIQDAVDAVNALAAQGWSAAVLDDKGGKDADDLLVVGPLDALLAGVNGLGFKYLDDSKQAYTEAISLGVFDQGADIHTPVEKNGNQLETTLPIVSITRDVQVTKGGKKMQRVTYLDPRASSAEAKACLAPAPVNGFFTAAPFRGAFSKDRNWLAGWTAADEFGMVDDSGNAADPTVTGSAVAIVSTLEWTDVAGIVYTIEKSYDGRNWIPVATVTGDGGSDAKVSDSTTVEQGVIYRVIVQ